MAQKKLFLRTSTRSLYDLQALRVSMGNRIVGNFKAKLGLAPSKKEDTLDKQGKKILDDLRAEHKLLADGVAKTLKTGAEKEMTEKIFTPQPGGMIGNFGEFCLVNNYVTLEKAEKKGFAQLEVLLKEFPVWTKYLSGIDGIGPQMGAVLIGEINIHDYWENGEGPTRKRCLPNDAGAKKKVCYASTVWKYAGLAVEKDGLGQSRKEQHLVDRQYMNKKGKLDIKKSITFNPFLKTKLLGVVGPSFQKMGIRWVPCTDEQFAKAPAHMRNLKDKKIDGVMKKNTKCLLEITHPMTKIYFDYRWRLDVHPKYKDETPEDAAVPDEADPEVELEGEAEEKAKKSKKGHRHRMALRFMVKQFLLQLHTAWRKIEGYPATPAYSQSKLGGGHYGGIEDQKP
jgi:hypothetical protein